MLQGWAEAKCHRLGPLTEHLLAQVDEEAALEQAVKFCQGHLGAAAQRQVSRTQRASLIVWGPPPLRPRRHAKT